MKDDEIWRVFAETGDPVIYLYYRSAGAARGRTGADTGDRPG